MLREYELTVIANSTLGEDETKKLFERYENILFANGGQVVKKNDLGTRRLSFPIKRQFRGRYMFYDCTTRPEDLKEAERLMRIDESVLRYMSVRIGENVDVEKRKIELAKFEASQAQSYNRDNDDGGGVVDDADDAP